MPLASPGCLVLVTWLPSATRGAYAELPSDNMAQALECARKHLIVTAQVDERSAAEHPDQTIKRRADSGARF